MRTQLTLVLLLAVVLAVLPGCQMNERLSGTAMGGVAGAAIGGLAGGWGGAVVGGAGGALVGYLVGDYVADQRERGRPTIFGDPESYYGGGEAARYNPPSYPQHSLADAQTSPGYPAMVAGLKVSEAQAAYRRGRQAKTAAEARHHYNESLRLDPTQPAVHNALGLHDLLQGNKTGAEQRFRTALRHDPANYAAKHNLRKMGVAGF